MNNFDRNTRTLLVSFLVAIFALIPLRFVEVGSQQNLIGDAQVLGEAISIPEETNFEAPYDEIEECINQDEIEEIRNEVATQLQNQDLNEGQIEELLNWLKASEANICS